MVVVQVVLVDRVGLVQYRKGYIMGGSKGASAGEIAAQREADARARRQEAAEQRAYYAAAEDKRYQMMMSMEKERMKFEEHQRAQMQREELALQQQIEQQQGFVEEEAASVSEAYGSDAQGGAGLTIEGFLNALQSGLADDYPE
jgi:hypothetical protein